MLKICYIVTLPVTIRSFFISQLKYLAENGFDVSVVCSPDNAIENELGNNIKYIPMIIPRGISIWGTIKSINNLTRLFKSEKFDLIQYSTPNAALCASIAGKRANIVVRNYHLMGFRFLGSVGIARYLLKTLEKITCRNSTTIECVSNSNLEIGIQERIFTYKKATVIWHGSSGGVDLQRFDFSKRKVFREIVRRKYGLALEDFVFGFVGRITRDKGINEILEAFSGIADAKLMLVGDLEGKETLNQELYIASLNNPRICYTGAVADVECYYAAMDVILLPSYREGFGNVIIEAAAMGTPAIVSNIPGPIDAIIDGKTALTVSARDSLELMQRMNEIRHSDYAKMGEEASAYVADFFDSNKLNHYILERKQKLLRRKH